MQVLCIPGHSHLKELPPWLCELPLAQLDLTYCKATDVKHLTGLTRLQNLSLQVAPPPPHQVHSSSCLVKPRRPVWEDWW